MIKKKAAKCHEMTWIGLITKHALNCQKVPIQHEYYYFEDKNCLDWEWRLAVSQKFGGYVELNETDHFWIPKH